VTVPLPLPRVLPKELTVEAAGGAIQIDRHRLHAHDAFERVQPRAGHEGVEVGALLRALARQLGVAHARRMAHAHQEALGAFHPQAVDQLLAQHRLRLGVHEQHAMLVQPDLAAVGAEANARAQIICVGRRHDASKASHPVVSSATERMLYGAPGGSRLETHQGRWN